MNILPDAAEATLSTAQTQALLTNLMATITTLALSRMPAIPVTDIYASNITFDLTTCVGDRTFEDILKPLDTICDGTAQTFPSFSSSLIRRANDGGWYRVNTYGILKVNGKNVLQFSQSIT